MSPGIQGGPSEFRGAADFDTTHWSVVLTAGPCSSPDSRKALSTLCQAYWYPLYAYTRRKGRTVEEAQDLPQEFFARLLEKDYLAVAQPGRGKFRTFLLTAFKHFLARLRDEFVHAGQADLFEHLKVFITPRTTAVGYAAVAGELHNSEVRFVASDLAIGGRCVADAAEEDFNVGSSISRERQTAAYWLQGEERLYSHVATPTILSGL